SPGARPDGRRGGPRDGISAPVVRGGLRREVGRVRERRRRAERLAGEMRLDAAGCVGASWASRDPPPAAALAPRRAALPARGAFVVAVCRVRPRRLKYRLISVENDLFGTTESSSASVSSASRSRAIIEVPLPSGRLAPPLRQTIQTECDTWMTLNEHFRYGPAS